MGCSCQNNVLMDSILFSFSFNLLIQIRIWNVLFPLASPIAGMSSAISLTSYWFVFPGSAGGSRQPVEGVGKCIDLGNWNKFLYIALRHWDCVWEEMGQEWDTDLTLVVCSTYVLTCGLKIKPENLAHALFTMCSCHQTNMRVIGLSVRSRRTVAGFRITLKERTCVYALLMQSIYLVSVWHDQKLFDAYSDTLLCGCFLSQFFFSAFFHVANLPFSVWLPSRVFSRVTFNNVDTFYYF